MRMDRHVDGGIFLLFLVIYLVHESFELNREKNYKVDAVTMCTSNESVRFKVDYMDLRQQDKNYFLMNVNFSVLENVTRPLSFELESSKCKLFTSDCAKYTTFITPNLCSILNDRHAFWALIVSRFKPPIRCPLLQGNYSIVNGTFDLSMLSPLPTDGYTWRTIMRIFEKKTEKYERRELLCFLSFVSVTLSRPKISRNRRVR